MHSAVTSRPSYLAGKGEEHRIKKQTFTIHLVFPLLKLLVHLANPLPAFGWNPQNTFFLIFPHPFPFSFFIQKNEKVHFDQRLERPAPNTSQNIQQPILTSELSCIRSAQICWLCINGGSSVQMKTS